MIGRQFQFMGCVVAKDCKALNCKCLNSRLETSPTGKVVVASSGTVTSETSLLRLFGQQIQVGKQCAREALKALDVWQKQINTRTIDTNCMALDKSLALLFNFSYCVMFAK